MTHRIFKHNGQVTDRIDTYVEASHISADERAAAEVAAALGVDVSTVTVEHVESIPAVEVAIPPGSPEGTVNPDEELSAALSAIDTSGIADAATKAAINAIVQTLNGQKSQAAVKARPNNA